VTSDGDRDGPGDAVPGDAVPGEREDRPELDVDAAFAAIVADFAQPLPAGVGPWPAAEDVDDEAAPPDPGREAPGLPDPARLRPTTRTPRHRLPDGSLDPGDRGNDQGPGPVPGEEDEERFVPPEPPPITSTDLASRLAWLGVLGGPLVLLLAALTWSRLPMVVVLVALSAFVGGFITLVARLPRDRDDGPDDGAVV
jgi:hypothetical protein